MTTARIRQLATFLFLTAASGSVFANDGFWLGDPVTGCMIWTDRESSLGDVVSWSGPCRDGKADGNGELVWFSEGALWGRYRGSMQNGRLNGNGVLYLRKQTGDDVTYDRYQGQFANSRLSGQLVYNSSDGDRFQGWVREGRSLDGWGFFDDANGDRYQGEIKDGKYEGPGILYEAIGGRYIGQFRAGKPDGKGQYRAPDGKRYFLNWIDGAIDGQVLVINTDGSREIQQWRQGVQVEPGSPTQSPGAPTETAPGAGSQ